MKYLYNISALFQTYV